MASSPPPAAPSSSIGEAEARKRKRSPSSTSPDPSRPHPHTPSIPSSQDARGVYVDIPEPSSSALAAFAPVHSQASPPPASMFDETQTHSEYVPSTQQQSSEMRPLPSIPVHAFAPFLDDTTGLDLETAEKRLEERERGAESSPVESFSPEREVMRPEDVPRVGAWVLPRLTVENSNPNPPDYSSQEVRSQIPFAIEEGEEEGEDGGLGVSQPSPRVQRRREGGTPIESTPAIAAVVEEPNLPPPGMIASQPSPELAFSSTPALPPPTTTQPQVSSTTTTTSSSLGWSTLPKPEVIELVHRSSHIPAFLKDEIERFITRATRTSSKTASNSGSSRRGSPRRRSNFHSHSQSQSRSHDDSETQEDGFLRTKKLWCMDLLRLPSQEETGGSEAVQRLTQSQSDSSSGAIAVILLLDTQEVTFDVHTLDEPLAAILRADRRYSILFDANGLSWGARNPNPNADSAAGDSGDLDTAQAQIITLQKRLEDSAAQIEILTTLNTTLTKERDEAVAQHDFVRMLYDRASASSSSLQAAAKSAEQEAALLQTQLTQGLALHRRALDDAVARWKRRVREVEAQNAFLLRQKEITEGGEVRRMAALWEAHVAAEEERERNRIERARVNEEKRRKLAAELGVEPATTPQVGDGLGPFAPAREGGEREPTPVDELDELAALAREAAEAGDDAILEQDAGRGRRSRRANANASNRPPPAARSAAEMADQLEAAQLSSANALNDSRQDVEDQFQLFPSTTTVEAGMGMGVGDFSAAPSANLDIGGEGGWNESMHSSDLAPAFTQSGAMLGNTDTTNSSGNGSREEGFEPHTQP